MDFFVTIFFSSIKTASLPDAAAAFWLTHRAKLRSQRKPGHHPTCPSTDNSSDTCSNLNGKKSELTEREKEYGLRILFHMRYFVRKKKLERLKFEILRKLVVTLQRWYRRHKQKKEDLNTVVGMHANDEFFLPELVAEAPVEAVTSDNVLVETDEEVPIDVPIVVARLKPFLPVLREDERIDWSAELIVSILTRFRAQQHLLRCKGVALVTQIAQETVSTANVEKFPDTAAAQCDELVELEPVDILLPKTVPGMIESGKVVVGPHIYLENTNPEEWVVDEVDDVEEVHVFDPTLDNAARKIQKFFHRYRTRRKLREAFQRAIDDIHNDIRSDAHVETSGPGCTIM